MRARNPGPPKRTKLVAIKNFDEELYRLVKAYASLEDRTIASIVEEALRRWMESRSDYEEVRMWTRLEREYEENLRALVEAIGESPDEYERGYALVCNGRVVGVFESYEEAIEKSRSACRSHGLVVELPYREGAEEVELGFPW